MYRVLFTLLITSHLLMGTFAQLINTDPLHGLGRSLPDFVPIESYHDTASFMGPYIYEFDDLKQNNNKLHCNCPVRDKNSQRMQQRQFWGPVLGDLLGGATRGK
uniref:Uncharacterized protein n=1 Tax=Photinus pyralis TaxID=7054 RepID=A0A1Y1MFB0_PHOPY